MTFSEIQPRSVFLLLRLCLSLSYRAIIAGCNFARPIRPLICRPPRSDPAKVTRCPRPCANVDSSLLCCVKISHLLDLALIRSLAGKNVDSTLLILLIYPTDSLHLATLESGDGKENGAAIEFRSLRYSAQFLETLIETLLSYIRYRLRESPGTCHTT